MEAAISGLTKKDVKVTFSNGYLKISGNKKDNHYKEKFYVRD